MELVPFYCNQETQLLQEGFLPCNHQHNPSKLFDETQRAVSQPARKAPKHHQQKDRENKELQENSTNTYLNID